MISACIYTAGNVLSLELEGHAACAPAGHDLVCAAVSTLAFAMDAYLDKEGLSVMRQETVLKPGRAKISVATVTQEEQRLRGVFEFAEAFLTLLEESYPENIELSAG